MAVIVEILNAVSVLLDKLSNSQTTFNVAALLGLVIILVLATRKPTKK